MARVFKIEKLTEHHYEIVLERRGLVYESGQWTLLIHQDNVISRPYSFASSPSELESVSFLFRRQPEGFTSWLAHRQVGEDVALGFPSGRFRPGSFAKEIWIGVGTGVAPFLSVLKGSSHSLTSVQQFLYGVRALNEAPYWSFLSALPCHPQLVTTQDHFSWDRLKGYKDRLSLVKDSHYFLCGVAAVVQSLVEWLRQSGIPQEHIHVEAYAA